MPKVLIICPNPSMQGGVASYYRLFSKYYSSMDMKVSFFHLGQGGTHGMLRSIPKSILDLCRLFMVLQSQDVVVLNPSLDFRSLVRDGLFHLLAQKVFKKKTLIFFHGWHQKWETLIEKYGRKIVVTVFHADTLVVLSSSFKRKLVDWGVSEPRIFVESTVFEAQERSSLNDPRKILFLSRFVPGKGCLEAIQTAEILAGWFPDILLYMAGDGILANDLRNYVAARNLCGQVKFTGWIDGSVKEKLLGECGVLLFPTQYGEGMPICILEAMGAGLAVISRPVAAISEVVVEGENGYLVLSSDPAEFAGAVRQLLQNPVLWLEMSQRNKAVAREKYEVRNAVKRLEKLYQITWNGNRS